MEISIAQSVISDNENAQMVKNYQHGGDRLINFLVGQAMKSHKGLNPQLLFKEFKRQLA